MRKMISTICFWLMGAFMKLGLWISAPKCNESECGEDAMDLMEGVMAMQEEQKLLVYTGSCFPVSNFNPHPAANTDYYVVALRNPSDQERTDIYMFTEKELIRAQDRADKNREDIPDKISDFDHVIERTED